MNHIGFQIISFINLNKKKNTCPYCRGKKLRTKQYWFLLQQFCTGFSRKKGISIFLLFRSVFLFIILLYRPETSNMLVTHWEKINCEPCMQLWRSVYLSSVHVYNRVREIVVVVLLSNILWYSSVREPVYTLRLWHW